MLMVMHHHSIIADNPQNPQWSCRPLVTSGGVIFVVKSEKIGAHVICAMLMKNTLTEGRTKVVEIDDIDPLVFKKMLRYLYTGKAPILDEDEMTEPLFLAAHKYQIEALKGLCEQRSIVKLNAQTIIHHLVMAHVTQTGTYCSMKNLESLDLDEHDLTPDALARVPVMFQTH
jgi:BTB/POZ domain